MAKSPDHLSGIRSPPTTGWEYFHFIGPSLILTATLVGSGELILTTTYGARFGFVALWMIVAACFFKVAIQEALGRYTISSGENSLEALNRLPGPRYLVSWAVWLLLGAMLFTSVQLGGLVKVLGESMSLGSQQFTASTWGTIACLASLVILISGHYQVVERASIFMVSFFSLSIIGCVVMIQWTDYAVAPSQLLSGFTFQLPPAAEAGEGGVWMALAIVSVVGLSATEMVYYPYWCLEKGYARFTGSNQPTEEWTTRARGWIRVMQLDCYFAMVVYTATTVAFYLLGAAVLHPRGEVPEGMNVVKTLSAVYTELIGPWAYYLFVASAFLVLYSTLFVTIASYSRLIPDFLRLMGILAPSDGLPQRTLVRIFLVLTTLLFIGTSQIQAPPVYQIVMGLVPIGIMLPVMCGAAIYLRFRCLDQRLRPSILLDVWLGCSALLTIMLTLYTLAPAVNKLLHLLDLLPRCGANHVR